MNLPQPPKPPCGRVSYHGLLSGFCGPEDEFEAWKASPRQRLLFKLEPVVQMAVVALLAFGLFGTLIVRFLHP